MSINAPFGGTSSPRLAKGIRSGVIWLKNGIYVLGLIALIWVDVAFAGSLYGTVMHGRMLGWLSYGDALSFGTSAVDIAFWAFGLYKGPRKGMNFLQIVAIFAAFALQILDTVAAMAEVSHLAYPTMPAGQLFPPHPWTQVFWLVEAVVAVAVFASTPLTALLIDKGVSSMHVGHDN